MSSKAQNRSLKRNKQTNASPPKRQKTRKATIPKQLCERVCGLVDPFCNAAIGAKYPDSSGIRTLAYSYRSQAQLASSNTGDNAYLVFPQYGYVNIHPAAAYAGGPNIIGWTASAPSGLIASVTQYRIVSCGFILKSIAAPLNASGYVQIRGWANDDGSTYNTMDVSSYNSTFDLNIPLKDCHEICVVMPRTAQMPQTFYDINDDTGTTSLQTASGFAPVTIYLNGCPVSTNCLVLEYYANYELIFEDGSGMGQVATLPPPANSLITSAANKLTSSIGNTFESGLKRLGDFVVSKALSTLASAVGGPVAGLTSSMLALTVD